ncbi:hypothetical protein [Natranaeroarchaeum sulfidigenes]|uniref:Putative trancriptional regulator, ArsR family n=1 Tax=Natranaeroarchaeum sulfidigenes TaxID=2784880 RepID=A0A897MQB5_9EURY|nr:hypothetical protein [Natranaeroarchaeum sulfidigenes]QSG02622.1 putative trancriptional regulator, ArsR family [Natranaeroarchaeum sulfidigenes]
MSGTRFNNGRRVIEKWNDVFSVLDAEPRRQIVTSLLDADGSVPLPESAVNPNASPDPKELRLELYHKHLPVLAEHGFIEWEADPFVAERGPRFGEVAIVFEALYTHVESIPDSLVIGC